MNLALVHTGMQLLRRRDESGGCGSLGCFLFLLVIGAVIYFVMKGRRDKSESLGTAKRAMGSGPIQEHAFACPYSKCPTCGSSGDRMKQQWDGLRKITWSCGYCGAQAGIQELKDEELPPSARQKLGLDAPPQSMVPGQGFPQGSSGGGLGGLLTGMMVGGMLGGMGNGHHHDSGNGSSGGDSGGDWGDSGGGSSDSGGDWGDSGGGDSGGGDSGGGGSDW